MGDTVKDQEVKKKSFFKTLKSEFKKVAWPDKVTVKKETIAVLSAAVALGLIITVIDMIIKTGLSFIL